MQSSNRDQQNVYIEAGEGMDETATFSVDQIATAFEVEPDRVQRAVDGEFGPGSGDRVDARMARHLTEVVLGDLPQDRRDAALMRLGAFTPRSDASDGIGQGSPTEESDRQSARAGISDDELASRRSSYDPATIDTADSGQQS
jgi:hypothetical protein